jgi:TP901 family phage tail tape measure protein
MSDSIEIASAYVSLTTKMPGVKKDVEASLGEAEGASEAAGARSGAKFGAALAAGVVAAAAVVAVAVAGVFAVGAGIDQARDDVRVFTTETGQNLDGLNASVNAIARETPAALDDIASTVSTLHQRLGLTGDDLETVAQQYLEAGRLFGEQVDVQATTGLFNVFKIGAGDVSGALDVIFNASRVAGVGMNELSGTLATAAPTAQLLGLSFEETAGFFATLSKAGVDVNRVAAGLGPALINLAKDGEQPADAFRRIVGEIQALAASGDTAGATLKAADLFGAKGAGQFVAALSAGTVNMDDLAGSVSGVKDTILGVAAETSDAAESWKVFKNNAMLAIEPVANAVFGLAGDGMAKIVQWAQANGPAIAGFFSQLGVVFGPLIDQVLQLWTQLSPLSILFQTLQPILPMILSAFAPLGPILAQIAQLAGELVAQIVPLVASLVAQLLPALLPLIGIFLDIAAAILPILSSLLPPLVDLLGVILTPVIQVLSTTLMALAPIFDLVGIAVSIVSGILQILAEIFGGVVKTVMALMKGDLSSIPGIWSGIWDKVVSIVRDAWGNVVDFAQSGVNGIIDLINGLIGGINKALAGVGLPKMSLVGHVDWSGAKFADGAYVTARGGGMLAQIGEGRHDEIVQPVGGPKYDEFVSKLAADLQSPDAASSSGPIDLSPATIRALARALAALMRPQSRNGGPTDG